ncbi:unnamed protein product [Sphagnum troendelagicum]|uniref:Transmembrane protein n=1 Tax=Sphagnum troendelagicum TaxID=128251 RepID=A0ABP0UAY3_9BRYO
MLQRTHSVHFNLTNKDILSTMIPYVRSPPSHGHLKNSSMIILEVDPRMYIESELKENKKVIWAARCMHCIHIIPFIIFICFVILWLGSSNVDPNNLNSTTMKEVMAINIHENQLETNDNANLMTTSIEQRFKPFESNVIPIVQEQENETPPTVELSFTILEDDMEKHLLLV